MGLEIYRQPTVAPSNTDHHDLRHPFGVIEGIDQANLRDTAYEIFFMACRSSPGFSGRTALTYHQNEDGDVGGTLSSPKAGGVGMAVMSRTKRALGLKRLRRTHVRRASFTGGPTSPRGLGNLYSGSSSSCSSGNNSPTSSVSVSGFMVPQLRSRRPMTSAEIMRQQMRVSDESDNRLRRTLMRTLAGQVGRRAETIILPLELLRHLKPSEFNGAREYHQWQIRQLKLLETGLVLYPSVPLDSQMNKTLKCFKDILKSCNDKAIETIKNSESMKALVSCVEALSWRTQDGSQSESCHWADGYPLNIHIYTTLLRSIFDLKDETLVLDEVDELLELMKKTWSILGISKCIHNLCFTWVLFQQYVFTGQIEADLLSATLAMLNEVEIDAKSEDREEALYLKILPLVLRCITKWVDKRLLNYHDNFQRETSLLIESLLPVVLQAKKILRENFIGYEDAEQDICNDVIMVSTSNIVDFYIRSSVRHAFSKLVEDGRFNESTFGVEEATEALIELAKGTERLALKEKEIFSPVLNRWYQTATATAAVTLHSCYGTLLKQYLSGVPFLANETIIVLQRAGKLENILVEMVAEDSDECDYGGKSALGEMVPYEVDSIILNLVKQWIQDRLKMGNECLQRAKETETWNPKSKEEPYAHSALELINLAKETVDDFLGIPLGISENLVLDLAEGLDHLFREYTNFVASCGRKKNYIPTLPPLTRCNRDSRLLRFWRKALCTVGAETPKLNNVLSQTHLLQRPSTSRGTQRLYIRVNTLHYLHSELSSLDKTLVFSPKIGPSLRKNRFTNRNSYFEQARSGIEAAIQHVSEVAAYRLIFLDTNSILYETLYVGNVVNSRIKSVLRIIKQNLTLLGAILTERALPLAMKDVMKASFEAFLMVLLAGGSSRAFMREDHEMIEEDFDSLKMAFCTSGEGLIGDDVVEREAETVEGVLALMRQPTDQLVEDFSILVCEASGIGIVGGGKTLPMPPTTGRWNRSDPNTILRVLCYRDDPAANNFLKNTFQLAKRK